MYQRLFGELHLSGFEVSHTKDGFRWEESEEELVRELRKALQASDFPILDQASNYRAKGLQRDHKDSAQRALDSLEDALQRDSGEQLGRALEEIEREPNDPLPKATVPSAKPFRPAGEDILKTFSLPYNGQEWQVNIVLSYDDTPRSWYEITDFAEDVEKAPRQLGIRLSMAHPFMDLYCDGSPIQTEALVRIAVCLALAETVARDSGQKFAGLVRTNFNELLRLALSSH